MKTSTKTSLILLELFPVVALILLSLWATESELSDPTISIHIHERPAAFREIDSSIFHFALFGTYLLGAVCVSLNALFCIAIWKGRRFGALALLKLIAFLPFAYLVHPYIGAISVFLVFAAVAAYIANGIAFNSFAKRQPATALI